MRYFLVHFAVKRRMETNPNSRGRVLLAVLAVCLILSGLFAVFQAISGKFLPHDEEYLGMRAEDLCALQGCRIVHFMIHDRVSFGGAIVAIGLLYLWLARQRQPWAWWLFLLSGAVGFGSFFAYLGYGYLDTWHGAATLALLPCFLFGLVQGHESPFPDGIRCLVQPTRRFSLSTSLGLGRACLLATTAGLVIGGLVIFLVGMTCVFVPQDLQYIGLETEEMRNLNPRLLPLIAHDRAGFGGAVCCCGLTMFFCILRGKPSRSLWLTLALAGTAGFVAAIGVHPAIGYNDLVHLAPAVLGGILYLAGLMLTFRPMWRSQVKPTLPRSLLPSSPENSIFRF